MIRHHSNGSEGLFAEVEILPGVVEKISEWEGKEYYIILTTGRKESTREMTVRQLEENHIVYDLLIMGIGHGERIVINDFNSKGESRTKAIDVKRNEGLAGLEI